jgi:hypothetical protein
MPRNIKKRTTLSHKEWAQTLQRYIEDKGEEWDKAEERHHAELRQAAADAYAQTIQDVQRGLHAMLEGLPFDQKLYEVVGRVLAEARGKAVERALNGGGR